VAAADINGDGRADIIMADGLDGGVIRGYDGLSLLEDGQIISFGAPYSGGTFVGGFGRWGDFANAVSHIQNGPLGGLQRAVAGLTAVEATLKNPDDRRRLGRALDLLYTALNSAAWLDNSHLSAKGGALVFRDEERASDLIVDLIQESDGTPAAQEFEQSLRFIARSDENLARIAIAGASGRRRKALDKALADFAAGEDEVAATFAVGNVSRDALDRALKDFRRAWREARWAV
jgi:hypothetical protein